MTDICRRLRMHADNKTKGAMQIDCEQAANVIDDLRSKVAALAAEQPQSEAEFDGLAWARKFAEFDPPAPAEQPQPVGTPFRELTGFAPAGVTLSAHTTPPPAAAPAEQPQPARIDPMQNPLRPTLAKLGPPDEHPAEEVLRKLAYWLGVGGYNAPTVDADLFHRKIVDGIQSMLAERPAPAEQPQPVAWVVGPVRGGAVLTTVRPTAGGATPLYAAPPPSAPQAEAPSQFARGIDAAARFVEKRLADYDAEHGSTDPDTGTREYPGTGDEYACELAEIAEAIRALAPPPVAPEPSEAEVAAAMASLHRDMEPAAWPSEDEVTDALRAAPAEQPQPVSGWIACDERMPNAGVEVLVWLAAPVIKGGSQIALDAWDEQHEAPLAWSSATIPIGMGWDSGADWESITHWMPLPAAPGSPPPPAAAPSERPQANTGHGHVRPRPDGVKARCGGPALCSVCQREQAALAAPPAAAPSPVVCRKCGADRTREDCRIANRIDCGFVGVAQSTPAAEPLPGTRPFDEFVAELEQDPQTKAELDEARREVRAMLYPPAAEPTDAMVEAAITAMDDVYSAHPAGQRPEITDQDRAAMRAAIDAALAAREGR